MCEYWYTTSRIITKKKDYVFYYNEYYDIYAIDKKGYGQIITIKKNIENALKISKNIFESL